MALMFVCSADYLIAQKYDYENEGGRKFIAFKEF